MGDRLAVSIGQFSSAGVRAKNQDFLGAIVPAAPLDRLKGVAIAIADGVSSSEVGHVAAETAVKSFLSDYYCTSEAWTVKTSAQRVISATNAWLNAMTRQAFFVHERDKGYVTTFTVIIFKGMAAHLFHIGDARVSRLSGQSLDQLTIDHRIGDESGETSYLARAMGLAAHVEIDYRCEPIAAGDVFVMTTDGVHEHVSAAETARLIADHGGNLDGAAERLATLALRNGSGDNVTVQIVRVESVLDVAQDADPLALDAVHLPPVPPALEPGVVFEGYEIARPLHISSRSHVYLAFDGQTGEAVAIKAPSTEMREDQTALRRFLVEDWIARRIDNPHVLKAHGAVRQRNYLYTATRHVAGQSLTQWMRDNTKPSLSAVRDIAGQIARGLTAFHRREMVHQDLRPDNILIDGKGTVIIIDFGAVRVGGVAELAPVGEGEPILGTQQYSAPEYFHGETGTARADIFSLGVIVYQMLTGRLPYGAEVSRIRSRKDARRLRYVSARRFNEQVPEWMDAALRKALQPDPGARYEVVSAFIADLETPNAELLHRNRLPLIERNPLVFWQAATLMLALTVVALAGALLTRP